MMIVADDDHIVVKKDYLTTGGAGVLALLLRTDGTLVAEGDGDAPGGLSPSSGPMGGIASNGSVIVFSAKSGTIYYCAASIPGLGDPGFTTTPKIITGDVGPIICDGDLFWVFSPTPTSSLRVFDPVADSSIAFNSPKVSAAVACFDGTNAWLCSLEPTQAGADQYVGCSRFPLREFPGDYDTGNAVFNPDPYMTSFTNPSELGSYAFQQDIGRMKFDGRDVWAIVRRDPSETGSGYVRRIPHAMLV